MVIVVRQLRHSAAAILLLGLSGCAANLVNDPVNAPLMGAAVSPLLSNGLSTRTHDGLIVALSFSGGGTRAAAFAQGVLEELAQNTIERDASRKPIVDHIEFVSGVSGGSIAAAYFGLYGKAGISTFRERFLLRNAEEDLRTSVVNPKNLVRIFAGGANDSTGFPVWLDRNLFNGATFGDLMKPGNPLVLINASDIYSRGPFVFGPLTFNSFCSDIRSYPLSQAVAASAAVPLVFTPIVIETFPAKCEQRMPDWVRKAIVNRNAPENLEAFARSLQRYGSGQIPYIKLLDGGLTDNLGLHGFLITMLGAQQPYEPLTEEDAVKVSEMVLFVVNAGRGPSGDWIQTVQGPSGGALLQAVTDTAIDSSVRGSFDTLQLAMAQWQRNLVRYRCSLSNAEVRRLRGSTDGWNCRNISVRVSEVSFADVDPADREKLDAIATRFRLPQNEVDQLIAAGHTALRRNAVFQGLKPVPISQ